MAGVPIKFRCYRCNQLLGVARSKVGMVVSCPKCAADLVVPDLDEAAATPSSSSTNNADLTSAFLSELASGMPLAIPDIRPEDIRVEPGLPFESYPPAPAEPEPGPSPPAYREPIPSPAEPPPSPKPIASEPVFEAAVPPIRVEPPRLAFERAPAVRSRDLVLPRSVVAFWSLFVLLAQALAFLAGLLAGHYLWRVH